MAKDEIIEEKKTFFKKVIDILERILLIVILAGFFGAIFFLSVADFNSSTPKVTEITSSPLKYKIEVIHENVSHVYYCAYYYRLMDGKSLVLVDNEGNITNEIFITDSTFINVSRNPEYKEPVIQKPKDSEHHQNIDEKYFEENAA